MDYRRALQVSFIAVIRAHFASINIANLFVVGFNPS